MSCCSTQITTGITAASGKSNSANIITASKYHPKIAVAKKLHSRRYQQRRFNRHSLCRCPERRSCQQDPESSSRENEDEDDVGAERTDEEDQRKKPQGESTEGEGVCKGRGLGLSAWGVISADGVVDDQKE